MLFKLETMSNTFVPSMLVYAKEQKMLTMYLFSLTMLLNVNLILPKSLIADLFHEKEGGAHPDVKIIDRGETEDDVHI